MRQYPGERSKRVEPCLQSTSRSHRPPLFSFLLVQKDKTAVPGLKRALSEGNGDGEKGEANTKSDLKRPKMQNDELEAKLELKITAKAGAHPKLEKVGGIP